MKYIFYLIFVFIIQNVSVVSAQKRKFTAGLNFRTTYLDYGKSPSDEIEELSQFKITIPISFRYYSKSIVGFQYQVDYRKENLHFLDASSVHWDPMEITSSAEFLINSFSLLLKINKASESNTSINFGLNHFTCLQQDYSQKEIFLGTYYGQRFDSSYSYSSTKWRHLRTSFRIGLSREVPISRFQLYWEVYYSVAIYNRQSEVPLFDPEEFGLAVGLAYSL